VIRLERLLAGHPMEHDRISREPLASADAAFLRWKLLFGEAFTCMIVLPKHVWVKGEIPGWQLAVLDMSQAGNN
jgi:hypothetical protein